MKDNEREIVLMLKNGNNNNRGEVKEDVTLKTQELQLINHIWPRLFEPDHRKEKKKHTVRVME